MKRIVAFLAAVVLSVGIFAATSASGQTAPPPPPPPTDASGDTLTTESATPAGAEAAADTAAAPQTLRQMKRGGGPSFSYLFSLAIGGGVNLAPDDFKDHYNPSFGGAMSFGVRRSWLTAAATFGYNFFLANNSSPEDLNPSDLNILTIFGDIRFSPLNTGAKPYVLVCGGYFRQWIVDTGYKEGVLGYGAGAGLEVNMGTSRKLFFDARYIQGQTRETQEAANTEVIPMRLGVTWIFK